ncbi:hypothetical protein [Halopseudomonas pelagia]|uniref:hypothetical protein n=1 Tax=Halopseudomonas pelagia TaxID=553151 RepID=UPI00117B8232|nr:hypothetical protein [Halopseudomonas pelagia]
MFTLSLHRATLLSLAAIAFSGCATAPPSDFKGLNPSKDHYTITATALDEHTIKATTVYRPANGVCSEDTEAFDWRVSRQAAELDREKPTSANEYSFKSPLSIHILGCQLNAAHSHLGLELREGQGGTHRTQDMYFFPKSEMPAREGRHESLRSVNQTRLCSHTFYIPRLGSKVRRFINCFNAEKDAGGYSPAFVFEDLKDKTIHYTFSRVAEDTPSSPRSWLKTPDGYRPCVNREFNSYCQDPPELKQFEMNGQQCDIYPGCTLPEGLD